MKAKMNALLKRILSILLFPFGLIGSMFLGIFYLIRRMIQGKTQYGKVTRRFIAVLLLASAGLIYSFPTILNPPIQGLNTVFRDRLGEWKALDTLPGGREITPTLKAIQIPEIPESPFILGLDLQGGVRVVYDVDLSDVSSSENSAALESLRQVVSRRVDAFGVSEPRIFIEEGESTRLIVELAGLENAQQAVDRIGETPRLQFYKGRPIEEREAIASKNQAIIESVQNGEVDLSQVGDDFFDFENPAYREEDLVLEGSSVSSASVVFDQTTRQPQVSVTFDAEGRRTFAEFTRDNIGETLFIVLDDQIVSGPSINEEIPTGQAIISGDFNLERAQELVSSLNAGALPVPITIASQQNVEASLGVVALEQSVRAAIGGLIVVALYMLMMYRGFGLVAIIALILYSVFVLALVKLLGFTLTLAGITGFIVSIGLAVDGNILIFERVKEELKIGHNFEYAIKEGFRRAWVSIRDSQISTFISALILFYLASGSVQGFAISLAIGVLVSMFTAVTVTRMMSLLVAHQSWSLRTRIGNWMVFMSRDNR